MKRVIPYQLLVLATFSLFWLSWAFAVKPDQTIKNSGIIRANTDPEFLNALKDSLDDDLLNPYYPTAEDAYGGFVEDRSSTWALEQNSDKFVVAQARYTWAAAKASQFYSANPAKSALFLNSAAVGFDFLRRMWGLDYGGLTGISMISDRDGNNGRLGNKSGLVVYGHAFAIYAAAAYYSASGEQAALDFAIDGYNFLDDYAHDNIYGGYYVTSSNTDKDTNVNLHVLESLIELYQAMPVSQPQRAEVANRIEELLARFHNDVIHCENTTDCFAYPLMDRNWTSSSNSISFGHDLELAMLMVEAIVAMGQDPLSSPYMTKIKKMVDFTFTHAGYRSDGGLHYTGTYSSGNVSVTDPQLQWWPQAESLGTACLMQKLFPADPFYSDTVRLTWHFIENEIIDQNRNGWVRLARGWDMTKAFEWHTNYHNSRAVMNCLNWLSNHCEADFEPDGDTDGKDLAILVNTGGFDLQVFAEDYGRNDCPGDRF